ncbi:class A beta-lactamase [Cryobacterium sp. TMT1-3]|uniref:class A beta-lactamase n=1 Tax=Cryobacterium sp. TMT1-3 TaxID=1259237 RepID=UPI00141BB7AB|nr:class A beta-lactamase [Cryobacterium sp. TMT1-3]
MPRIVVYVSSTRTFGHSSRRSFLVAGAAAVALAGCTTPSPALTSVISNFGRSVRQLESTSGVMIAVSAKNVRSGRQINHRATEPVPMCSLFKVLAVANLLRLRGYEDQYWNTPISFTAADLVVNSPVATASTSMSMTPNQMADAALRFSDNTAGNLLLRELGGPATITEFAQALGAKRTRLERIEPELNEGLPGDVRDTTTAEDMVAIMKALLIDGDAGQLARSRLQDLMLRNTTSGKRARAGLSEPFELADKTGAGDYGIVNDAGVLWQGQRQTIAMCILTRTEIASAPNSNDVIADATRLIVSELAA